MYFYDEDDDLDKYEEDAEEALNDEQEAEDVGGEEEPEELDGNAGSTGNPIQDAVNKVNAREKNDGAQGDESTPDSPAEPGISGGDDKDLAGKAANAIDADEKAGKAADVADQAIENAPIENAPENGSKETGNETGNETGESKGDNKGTSDEKSEPSDDNKGTGGEKSEPSGDSKGTGDEKGANPNQLNDGDAGGKVPKAEGGSGLEGAGIAKNIAQGYSDDGVKGAAKEGAKEAAKQVAKEKAKQMGLDVMLKSITSALAPILFWVAIVLLIIIIAVGLIMFFIAMPGQIIAKVRTLGLNVIKAWTAMVKGEDEMVTTTQLANAANYIEKMGYDLKGEGFVSADKTEYNINHSTTTEDGTVVDSTITSLTKMTSEGYDDSSDLKDMSEEELNALLYLDEKQGVIRRNDTQEVVDLNSDPLFAYIVSDNQCYIIRNFNTSLDEMSGGNGDTISNILLGIAAVIGAIVMIVVPGGFIISLIAGMAAAAAVAGTSYLAVTTASNPDWGTGLITIYHEGSDIGIRGDYYKDIEKGYIALDAESKQLKIKRGWANGIYSFDVDGWSGRYGMPLEFLLSVHLATQMPDLAIEMATAFDTQVEVLLHPVNGSMTAGILKEGHSPKSDDDFITYATISELGKEEQSIGQSIWEGLKNFANGTVEFFTGDKVWTEEELEELGINEKVMCTLFDEEFPHSLECTCCSHIPGTRYSATYDDEGNQTNTEECEGTDLYDEDGNVASNHKICDACQNRIFRVIAALQICNDKDWESYTPYISKVTDHWFRDVYFVMNEAENEFADVVQVDEEYFYETGERWTMYETWEEGESIPEGFAVGDYKLYEEGSSTPSNLSKEEVEEINEKIANGDTSVTRLVKKAITTSLTPNTENGTDWSAYTLTDENNELDWEQMSVDKDSAGELTDDAVYADEDASTSDDILIYYKESRPADIKQEEDGQRTETNAKIKDMFLNKKYYKYDGSVDRADAIIEDRANSDPDTYNTDSDNRNEDLIAKVDINKDSLSAFSILENTHTLDADYIYRDFKELIVELNYFDKEDLSDKIQEVMQWLIPDAGSAGWPFRKYEKGETFYGTLINSKVDLKLMEDAAIEEAEEIMGELEDEVETTETTETTTTTPTPTNVAGSITSFVDLAYEIHAEMEGNNWDYCVRNLSRCNHKYGHACGLNESIQDAIANYHNTCCATYVSWVLEEIGYGFQSHGAQETYNKVKELGFTPITDYDSLEPGDLLFNNSSDPNADENNIGHVQILGNDGEWLNAGSVDAINNKPSVWTPDFIIGMRPTLNGAQKQFEGYEPDQDVVSPVTGKIIEHGTVERENIETGEKEEVEFIKIQAIDHCVYDTDGSPTEQGKGYKAAVNTSINNEEYGEGGRYQEYDPDVQNSLEGYDYFYEEYEGVIDSFVIYIEGFDLTLYDADGAIALCNSGEDDSKVSRYEPNTVYNMNNNDEEAYALWKEDAKAYAKPYVVINGEEYIKEGTIIGKTCEDPEVSETADGDEDSTSSNNGNGNYIRIILRDLEDSIVEDVESYMKIDDGGYVSTAQPYQAQDGELELLAALICHEGGAPYWMNCHNFDEETAMAAAEAVGYVCINRALTNYGGYGTTITEQINAPGQYASAEELANYDYCEKCLEAAEWCLKYDCMSITNPDGEEMTREVQGQSGWCHCNGQCWWWIDTTEDGERTTYDDTNGAAWDTFFCRNGSGG